MIPQHVTSAIVEEELHPARAWAGRHGISLEWVASSFEIRLCLTQPETELLFYLKGRFDNYRAIPPLWEFCDSSWTQCGEKKWFPTPIPGPSIFHGAGLICAPFNRRAYMENRGPHGDWGSMTNWLHAGGDYVRATTIGDMLQVIRRDFLRSRGRMK